MFSKFNFFLLLLSAVSFGRSLSERRISTTVEMHHSLGPESDPFTYRGNITILTLNFGVFSANQVPLTTTELEKLGELAKGNDFYRMQATVVYPNGMKQNFLTFSKACGLLQSDLNDVLWITLDPSGFITAITHASSSGSVDCRTDGQIEAQTQEFTTDVIVKHAEVAPMPDTASFIEKLEREREARERGEFRDDRGFIAKYWMYFVPVLLLIILSGATHQEAPK
ncbi:ER membrane protein complex subunit 10-like [Scaptodrosophila lebanonensis]|uniref:ER membrane protein complex subunit 10 n=1 Tax=Drosophila lebanonensis TaxID=7225 RepID=A0A6J2TDK4_DROLE|nr:ER membrane protein complex subunit 10-like [Scaptodrosophila lebanonensis]